MSAQAGWQLSLGLALLLHAGLLALPVGPEPREPLEFIDFQLAEPPAPIAAPAEAPPEETPAPEPIAPQPKPEAPLPPPPEIVEEVQAPAGALVEDPARDPGVTSARSNRPDQGAPGEEVPVVTGLPLTGEQLVEGGMGVRVGNTNEAGYDAPEGYEVRDLTGFTGGGQGGGGSEGVAAAGVTARARVLRAYAPKYPRDLRMAGIEGRVRLRVEVLPNGRAGRVEIVEGLHPRLDLLAVETARRCRYQPAKRGAERVASTIPLSIRFSLEDMD